MTAPSNHPPLPLEGGCLCGELRYRVTQAPLTISACHCRDCQKRTSSAFALSMIVHRAAVELLGGEPSGYCIKLRDGRTKCGRFCASCGSRLWGEPERAPDYLVVQPGSLDRTDWLAPVAHIWTSEGQAWALPRGTAACFPGNPPSVRALIDLWAQRHGRRASAP